jgi:hypothetical protein
MRWELTLALRVSFSVAKDVINSPNRFLILLKWLQVY